MGKVAFLFAGQGAQAPGMGQAFYDASPAAKQVFDAVEAVRPGTLEQCFHGDAAELTKTANTQPCLFATDLACAMAAVEAGVKPDCCAGFSLGELCAVAFSEMLPLDDAAKLVVKRGETMQACNDAHPGAMAAILKLSTAQVEDMCADLDGAYPVNYNSPGQTVVACDAELLPVVSERTKAAGGRCLPLKVGGSFHTPVMRPATDALNTMLDDMSIAEPMLPVYANSTAGLYTAENEKTLLSEQASSPVRWQQITEAMWADGVDTFVEFGPGTTLAGLVKRTLPEAKTASVSDPESLEKCIEMLRQEGAA